MMNDNKRIRTAFEMIEVNAKNIEKLTKGLPSLVMRLGAAEKQVKNLQKQIKAQAKKKKV